MIWGAPTSAVCGPVCKCVYGFASLIRSRRRCKTWSAKCFCRSSTAGLPVSRRSLCVFLFVLPSFSSPSSPPPRFLNMRYVCLCVGTTYIPGQKKKTNIGGLVLLQFSPKQWQRQGAPYARGRRQGWWIFRGPRKPSPRRGTGEGNGPSGVACRPAECSDGWPGKLLLPCARPVRRLASWPKRNLQQRWLLQRYRMSGEVFVVLRWNQVMCPASV